MAEQSPSQLINDWVAAAKSANPNNAKTVATTIANFYTSDAVLCATEGIIKDQSNILADYEGNFEAGWVLTGVSNQSSINQINQDWAWVYGQWTGTVPNPNQPSNTIQLQGSWSILFVNQPTSNNRPNWLIQQHTIVTNLPSA